ncbi:hypothetical protein ACTM9D_04870, partial [Citrobacter freundii]
MDITTNEETFAHVAFARRGDYSVHQHSTGQQHCCSCATKTSKGRQNINRAKRKNPKLFDSLGFMFGGSVEIRTLEPFRVAGFQDRKIILKNQTHNAIKKNNINTRS